MTSDLIQQLGIASGGVITTLLTNIAVFRVQIREIERRIGKQETAHEKMCTDLPKDYVPRRELHHRIANIEQGISDLTYHLIGRTPKAREYKPDVIRDPH